MLTITAMTIGGVEYLLRSVACAEAEPERAPGQEAERDAAAYYAQAERSGEAPGVLRGRAAELLGFTEGERPSEDQARRVLAAQDPHTGEWLGRAVQQAAPLEQRQRDALRRLSPDATEEQQREALRRAQHTQSGRSFYDLTFAPDKSVSALYAAYRTAGEHELADAVLEAHNAAVSEAMTYVEEETYTRTAGSGQGSSIRYEYAPNIVRLDFQHTTSRATDPHLHTHVAVINRVPCEDGQWRAVHGKAWRQVKPAAASVYESRVAERIEEATPARFTAREDGVGRQVAGIDEAVMDESSQRTRQVLDAQERATTQFRADYGRDPEPAELRKIHRLAGKESRAPKSEKSPGDLLDAWSQREGIDADKIVRSVREAGEARDFWGSQTAPRSHREVILEAISAVQAQQAHWPQSLLQAYIADRLPTGQTYLAEELARQAVSPACGYGIVDLTRREPAAVPDELTHDGSPQWRDPSLGAYASADHLASETALAGEAAAETVGALDSEQLAAIEARWSAEAVSLNEHQRQAVLGILGSKRQGDVVVAAAGSGKSHMAGVLTDEWHRHGGTVHGVTTSQRAAHVLSEHGLEAANSTQWLRRYEPDAPAAGGQRLAAGDAVVMDEANMSSTAELRRVQRVCARDGAKLVLVGDPAQLSAVGAGGALDHVARTNGSYDLPEPLRFSEQWERDASQRLRAGDVSVLDEYVQRGRVHGGTREAARSAAVDRYCADQVQGRSALLITATNSEAAEVSQQVQHRLGELGVLDTTAEPLAADMSGLPLYTGDRLEWRLNTYNADADHGQAVVNREYLTLAGSDDRGRAHLEREDGSSVYVPWQWVSERAELGYATTEHGAEGVTVDAGYALTPGYVAMTRGRHTNETYLETQAPGDAHSAPLESSAREQFAATLERDGEGRSAIETWRAELAEGRSTARLAAVWEQASEAAMRQRTAETLEQQLIGGGVDLDSGSGQQLLRTVTQAELDGHDTATLLGEVIDSRSLSDASDVGAVLAARTERALRTRQPERATDTWTQRAAGMAEHGSELGTFTRDVGRALDTREAELGAQAAQDTPTWAQHQLGECPPVEQADARAAWQHSAGRAAAYRERCGIAETVPSLGARPHEQDLHDRAAWYDAARAVGRDVDADTYVSAPVTDLEAHRARWRRVCEQAPAYVADELGHARRQQAQAEADATLLDQQAEAARSDAEAQSLRESAAAQRQQAAVAGERAGMLARVQTARDSWQAEHEPLQDRAREAERELRRRGREVEAPTLEAAPEQGTLFEIGDPEPEREQHAERDTTREQHRETGAELAADQQQQRHTEAERAAEEQRQGETEREQEQQALLDVTPNPADVARQTTVARTADADTEADAEASQLVSERQTIARTADAQQTLREAETHARWAEDVAAQSRERERQRAEQREAERAERDRREQPEATLDIPEHEIPLPPEPEPELEIE